MPQQKNYNTMIKQHLPEYFFIRNINIEGSMEIRKELFRPVKGNYPS